MVITMVVVIGITLELVIITLVVITIVEGVSIVATSEIAVVVILGVSMVATGEIAVVVILIIKTGIVVSTDSWDVIIIALVGTSDTDKLPPFMTLGLVAIVFDIITVGMNVSLVGEAIGDNITLISTLTVLLITLELFCAAVFK